jgi:hypothetical protein
MVSEHHMAERYWFKPIRTTDSAAIDLEIYYRRYECDLNDRDRNALSKRWAARRGCPDTKLPRIPCLYFLKRG